MWLSLWLACHLHSGLSVPAGEQFVLGDNPHGRFSVRVVNVGAVAVDLAIQEQGEVVSSSTLAPGERTRAQFSAAQMAVFVNTETQDATLSVDVTGAIGLSMGCTPLP